MKKFIVLALLSAFIYHANAQQYMPKDVKKVYKAAVKLTKKGEYNKALDTYNEVLRSVEHIPSLIACGDIEMNLKSRPNYREAYEYYNRALIEIDRQLGSSQSKSSKMDLANTRKKLVPKHKKAKSYVDDFDDAKKRKEKGQRLMKDKDLN